MVKNLIEENVISVSRKYKYHDNKSNEYEIHTDTYIVLLDKLISEYRIDIFLSELVDNCSSNILQEIIELQEKSKKYMDSLSKYSNVKSLNPKKNIHKCVIYTIKDVNLAHLIDNFIDKVKTRMASDADINCIDVFGEDIDKIYADIDEAEQEQHQKKLVYSISDDYRKYNYIDFSQMKIDKRILNQFENKANPNTWEAVNIRTKRTFSNDDLYFLCYFFILIIKSGTLWSYVELEKDYLKSHIYSFQMNIKVKVYKNKGSYTFIPSCRQTNDLCRMDSYSRKKYLLTKYEIDTDYDLHSTVNVIARLLNTGQFDTSWDIKNYLEDLKPTLINGELLTRYNGLKVMTQRLFFRKSTG